MLTPDKPWSLKGMKKILFVLKLMLAFALLSACSAALLGGNKSRAYGTAGGNLQASDRVISATVHKNLAADPVTAQATIQIETSNAIVVLKGDVVSVKISQRAEEIAGQVDGVRAVRNHLWVRSAD